jgi:saxitoxin biosynthesis operon SxtJ-like protein
MFARSCTKMAGPEKVKKSGTFAVSPDKAPEPKSGPLSTVAMTQSTHESFSREEASAPGSDRTFGLVMAGFFALLALINGWHAGRLWPWELALAVFFLAASLTRPSVLHPLNRLWMKFGLLLHAIVNPIVMGLLFYGTIWPTGVVMRMRGRDLLRLKREPASSSYWIPREPGPKPETMRDQF